MKTDAVDPILVTYFKLRQTLGIIALLFPVTLLAGGYITEGSVLPSISDYYFSSMRDLVVGALVAIGIFLMAYKGDRLTNRDWLDTIVGLGAGGASIGLAIFPNKPHNVGVETFVHAIMHDQISVFVHFLSSFIFLAALTVYCLRVFARGATPYNRKAFCICGYSILIAGITATFASFARAFDWFSARHVIEDLSIIFWLETAGIWAFCIAWLLKGKCERRAVRLSGPVTSRPFDGLFVRLKQEA